MAKKFNFNDEEFSVQKKEKDIKNTKPANNAKDASNDNEHMMHIEHIEHMKHIDHNGHIDQESHQVSYGPYVSEETEDKPILEYGKTRGKKGQKLPRLHLAFSTSNYDYLRKTAARCGLSSGAFINLLLDKAREGVIDITTFINYL